jgi:integrase
MRFTYRGRQVRKSTETGNKKLAERIHGKVLNEIAEGKWFDRLPGEQKTFAELIEKYLLEHSAPNKAPMSHKRDKSIANNLLRTFAELRLTEITPRLISEYKRNRREAGAKPATVNHELKLMGHAFKLAINEWEWLNVNPVTKVSKERVNNEIERWLTLEEEERLLAACPGWVQEIVLVALHTGLRQSELLNLRWRLVDLRRKTLTLLVQKNRSKDTLPLNESALKVLTARNRVRHIKTDHVFYSGNGTRIDASNLMRSFRKAVKEAGIEKFRFHDLRHTFATRLAQAGVDMYMIQRLGRWKTTQMVARYAHHYSESLRPGVAVLDKISTILAQSNDQGATEIP